MDSESDGGPWFVYAWPRQAVGSIRDVPAASEKLPHGRPVKLWLRGGGTAISALPVVPLSGVATSASRKLVGSDGSAAGGGVGSDAESPRAICSGG